MKPTYLYIKQHSITGLKYFGKTTRDPYTYIGSGRYWKSHINKHGEQFVKTIWVSEIFTEPTLLSEFAIFLSEEFDIVNSPGWANLILENGLDGGQDKGHMLGKILSKEHKQKISESSKGRKLSEETKQKMRKPKTLEHVARAAAAQRGRKQSPEHLAKLSAARKGRLAWNKGISQQLVTCPHCNQVGGNAMYRWHFDNCKLKGNDYE
jgi:hypothetical protein